MTSLTTTQRVPAHLRPFVVEQDWDAYTPVDHAVWRFVLAQLYRRLVHTAHPAYARGLTQVGMGVERIPRIGEMDAHLGQFGWGAVCVDGFIPPRAFQEFQALGILPIAAEIRRVDHLAYTPAPDIIHEAGGHAPILPDPQYATFLRRIGEYGMRAFGSAHDAALYAAIARLSVVKESRDTTPEELQAAEHALSELVAAPGVPSEAALLARLYWWTVEYGLVGRVDDFKLYGAGMLSSLAEGHFCHDPQVRKLPLHERCIEVEYDITRPQPQLFVARDFEHLEEVLDAACAGFAFRCGGVSALHTAVASGEVATVTWADGLFVTGSLARVVICGAAHVLVFRDRCGVGRAARLLAGNGPLELHDGLTVIVGDDASVAVTLATPKGATDGAPGDGRCLRALVEVDGARVSDGALLRVPAMDATAALSSVMRGAVDAGYWPAQPVSGRRVPAPTATTAMDDLYVRVLSSDDDAGRRTRELLAAADTLDGAHPQEWLLRFYALEALQQLDVAPERRARLVSQLGELERHFGGRYPIASALRYLGHAIAP